MSRARNLSRFKPSTTGLVANANIASSAAIAKTKLAALDIVNADVNSSAAIAQSKMAALASTNMPTGTVVQVSHSTGTDFVGGIGGIDIAGGQYKKILEKSITFKTTNPHIYVSCRFGIGTPNAYYDHDLACGFGYKTGSGTTSISDYSAFGGNSYQRQNVNPLSSFYACDTHGAHSSGAQYWVETKSASYLQQISQASGTTIVMAVWCSVQNGNYYIHRPETNPNSNDAGELGGITVMELKS